MKKIIVGSRDSRLAIDQTKLVMDAIHKNHPQIELELVTLKTTGDLILDQTLDKIGGKGLFVKELDKALYDGRIDIAVHSLKDMPMEVNEELPIAAMFQRGDPRDALVLPKGSGRDGSLTAGICVGSSSARRKLLLHKICPGIGVKSIRGNIITRLEKLDHQEYDALVLAAAGLQRVGLTDRISHYFPVDEMIPAAGQGILAVQAKRNLDIGFLAKINDLDTMYAGTAERSFVASLNGGCSSPIAAHAVISGNEMKLTGLYYKEETKEHRAGSVTGSKEQARDLGVRLAEQLKEELA